jgi:type IV pilus assembly protein PilC
MQVFEFVAWDTSGHCHEGIRQAKSRQELLGSLRQENLTPVSITEVQSANAEEKAKTAHVRYRRVRSEQLATFCWQLATMIEGGLSITSAIQTIAEDITNPYFEFILKDISSKLESGETFSDSIKAYPKVFNNLACSMAMAGETGGSLITSLRRLAEYYQERDKLIRKVRGAMAYPAFVVAFIVVIVIVLMTMIVPRFQLMFDTFKGELPAFTRAFMAVYHGLVNNIVYIIIGLAVLVIGSVFAAKTEPGHALLCRLELNFPLIGRIKRMAFICMFCRTLATLVAAGVTVMDSFLILADMNSNDLLRNGVLQARQKMTEGTSMAESLAGCGLFPGVAIKMTLIGEQSGSLVPVLEKTGEFYARKVDELVSAMLGLLEPILIVTVGAIVLVVLLAMYLPIFSMSV